MKAFKYDSRSASRVRTFEHSLEVGDLDPGVTLCGLKRFMAEEHLDMPDVGPAPKQVRRHAVTECVASDAFFDAGFFCIFLNDSG
jgi:hypothetical protein